MTDRPTNILLITSDQHHYSALGVDNPKISTPALDRLAREGLNLRRAYCPNPTCTPTRASMITGQYPSVHGAWSLGTKLAEDMPTPFVGDLLGQGGYATSLIGKAHFQPLATAPDQTSIECQPTMRELDFWRDFHGPWYGFEHVETARMHADEAHAGQHYAIWMEEQGFTEWRDHFQNWPADDRHKPQKWKWTLPERYHYSVWTAERTVARIEQAAAAGKPFFCWSSFHDPHPPYLAPEPWDTMYDPADMELGTLSPGELDRMPPHFGLTQRRDADWSHWRESQYWNHGMQFHPVDPETMRKNIAVYYGMVSLMDREIGRILGCLDRLGLADNTLVVFTTDHGHYLGQHGLTAKGPFHYEDGIRVPFLVRGPGVPQGGRPTSLLSLVDLAPTFLAAAGQPVPGFMQGVSQLDVWQGRAGRARDSVIVEHHHQPTRLNLRTYIDDRYKLSIYRDEEWGELFDLATDPGERCNRWSDPAYAEIKAALMHRFLNAELQREPMRYPRIAGA
ncbi:MAG: Arylsulfatase [Phycisphaerae bacterium]|nr:Arylsulfatase [Phycisphaerae bacterium]